jgi:steroid delta-isomerase-like uncharacterized protein
MMRARKAPEVADLVYDAYNNGDLAAVGDLYADGASHEEVATGRVNHGPTEIVKGLGSFVRAFPDAHWHKLDHVHEGGLLAVRYRLTGTLQADLGPFTARGQHLDLHGIHWIQMNAGHIAHCRDFWDSGTFARQMA